MTLPSLVAADYKPNTEDTFRMMAWKDQGDQSGYELYVVVNIPKGAPEKMTADLAGPILINNKAREAVQLVLVDSLYSHRHPLLQAN